MGDARAGFRKKFHKYALLSICSPHYPNKLTTYPVQNTVVLVDFENNKAPDPGRKNSLAYPPSSNRTSYFT